MTDNAINKVLYNLDQRADTTAEEKKTARDNIGALGPDELASVADERYKLLQSPLLQTYAANAVIDRVEQNAQGVVNIHCSYLSVATGDSNGLMSTSDKNKLDGIQSGAEVNVQANWAEDDPASDSYIQNKPTFLQTQADWAQTDSSAASYIQNKPDLSQYATQQDLSGKQDVLTAGDNITITNNVISATAAPQQQANWTENDNTSVSYIQNKPNLATVATTGQYSDLLNVPDLTQYKTKQAVVGESFAANAVIDRLDQDANGVVSIHCSYLSTATTSADGLMSSSDKTKLDGISNGAEPNVQADWTETDNTLDSFIRNKPTLATVATTGEYSDLLHVPDLTQYKTKQSVIAETFAANAVIDRLDQTANGEVSVHCSYLSTATTSADGLMSSSDKTKLDGIASGAEVNVQSNWTENDSSSDSYIQNKPANLVQDANYVHTDNNYTTAEKNKLSGIETGAEVNVQSDWNQVDILADDFIKNKPIIPVLPPTKELVAGTGISLVEGNDSVTISSTISDVVAGNGIDITGNEVSVLAGTNLGFEGTPSIKQLSSPVGRTTSYSDTYVYGTLGQLNADTVDLLKNGTLEITTLLPYTGTANTAGVHLAICSLNSTNIPNRQGYWLIADSTLNSATSDSYSVATDTTITADFSTLHSSSNMTWSTVEADPTSFYLAIVSWSSVYGIRDSMSYASSEATASSQTAPVAEHSYIDNDHLRLYADVPASSQIVTMTSTLPPVESSVNKLTIIDNGRVMADTSNIGLIAPYGSQADEGKVLTHHYSGSPGICWASWDAPPEAHTVGFIDVVL